MVGENAKLFSFIDNKNQVFKELPFQQQMAVIYHELLHLLITYHQLMIPELARTENNSVTRFLLPNGFSNLLHDFIIDTIGSELARQKALLRITFDDLDLATWHYYTHLKAPPGNELNFTTSVQITDFWYGNYIEGRHYPPPKFFELPDELHPVLKHAFTLLEQELQKTFDKLLVGISRVCENIRNRADGYIGFWNDEYLLAPWTKQRIILDTVQIVKEFNDDLDRIQELATTLIPELGNLFDVAEQIDITIDKNVVRIKGSLNKHNKNVYYSEFTYGSFERVIKLPYEVKLLSPEEYKVTYQDGVLEIQLPKAIEQRGVRIKFSEA